MATRDELLARSAAIEAVLVAGAGDALRAIPGVIHVTVGLKESAGIVSDTLAIRVYVKEKVPLDQLSVAARIPSEIQGAPTDVNVVHEVRFAADNTRYRPVLGGIQITNKIVDLNDDMTKTQISRGTYGCTGTLTSDKSIVLLSNWHVLMANGGRKGDRIYQPAPLTPPHADLADVPLRPPTNDTADVIAKIVDSKITDHVDAAIARLDVSSCCRCCGLDYRDQVNGLVAGGHPASGAIKGSRPAVAGSPVYKVGMKTGRTAGKVLELTAPGFDISLRGTNYHFEGQMTIVSNDPTSLFMDHGDSGSALVDEDGYVVGLLFATNNAPPPAHRAKANHIADVCNALGITINATSGSGGSAGARLLLPEPVAGDQGAALYAAARARLMSDAAGTTLWALAEAHREEIVRLVTTHRPVTVAWHRAGGPALFALGVNALSAGDDSLPVPRDGGTLADAMARVGDALHSHGSPALRDALARHRELLIGAAARSATLPEFLAALGNAWAVAAVPEVVR